MASCIVRHMDAGDSVAFSVPWYDNTMADDTFDPPEHITEHFIIHFWRRMEKLDAALHRNGGAHASRKWKVPM